MLLPPLLFLIILLHHLPPSTSTIQYVSYQPAVNIIYSDSSTSPPPPAPRPQQGGAGTVPFSPAIPPNCPTNTQSCSSIGEPSWCCTTAQHCAFDDAGDVACCPVGNFCRGVVDYGTGAASNGGGGAGGGDSGGSGSGGETPSDTWNLPGISNGNGGVTITSGAATRDGANSMDQRCGKLLVLVLIVGLGLWTTGPGGL